VVGCEVVVEEERLLDVADDGGGGGAGLIDREMACMPWKVPARMR